MTGATLSEVAAVLELSATLPELELRRLVMAAYAASRTHPVLVVLPRDLREVVDRMLDESVKRLGTGVMGVRYADPIGDEDEIMTAVTHCPVVIATSDSLRQTLSRAQQPVTAAAS